MDNFQRSLIFIIFFCSGNVFADSYPYVSKYYTNAFPATIYDSGAAACTGAALVYDSTYTGEWDGTFNSYTGCVIKSSTGQTITQTGVSENQTCPSGGSQIAANGPCENAPVCPEGQTRQPPNYACAVPPVQCTYTEYNDTPTSCAKIPNCYLLGTGDYFDLTTKSCVNSFPDKVCISGVNHRHYCQVVDECVLDTTICSNNPDFVTLVNNDRAIRSSQARVKAIDDQQAIDDGVNVSSEQATAKDAEVEADKAAMAEYINASKDPAATQEQQAQAKLDYAEWLKRELQDKAEAANAWDAYDRAQAAKKIAEPATADAQIQDDPGNATADSEIVAQQRDIVDLAVNDAITGTGNGTGTGTGTQVGLPTPIDNTVAAVKAVKASVDAVKDAINNKKTDCQLTPNAVGCATLEAPGAAETLVTDEVGVSSSYTSWGAGSCPSSVLGPHGVVFDYQPMCSSFAFFKPILISVGLILSLFIVSGGVKD